MVDGADGDGLTDWEEVELTLTDPLEVQSYDGVMDGEGDFDGDLSDF